MSSTSSRVTDAHLAYLAERTAPEPGYLAELRRASEAAGIPAIQISPEQASFMQILLRLSGSREVVEVGTLAGYSALAMALALPAGGRVRTIEIDPVHADFARRQVAGSAVPDRVEVHLGAGADVLRGFADGSADAAFVDADKAGYRTYVRECLRIVRPGGLVMVDNAFAFGQLFDEHPTEPSVEHVRAFNDWMAGVEELQSIIVPVGDGQWVGVVREA